jgi:chemotaxis protein CheY-P-specific phosphatase CheC
MADGKLRTCSVDGVSYKYCPRCKGYNPIETWRFAFCSENCKDIYNATSSFEDGRITANEAKVQLDKLDLSKSEMFGESYKNSIAKIYSETIEVSTPVIEEESIEIVEEVNTASTDEVSDEVEQSEENIEEEKPRNYRRSKKKTVDDVE